MSPALTCGLSGGRGGSWRRSHTLQSCTPALGEQRALGETREAGEEGWVRDERLGINGEEGVGERDVGAGRGVGE